MSNRCKQFDIFGQTISLNYRGNNTHRTVLGACISIPVFILVLLVFGLEGYKAWVQPNSLNQIRMAPPMLANTSVNLAHTDDNNDYPYEIQVAIDGQDFDAQVLSIEYEYVELDAQGQQLVFQQSIDAQQCSIKGRKAACFKPQKDLIFHKSTFITIYVRPCTGSFLEKFTQDISLRCKANQQENLQYLTSKLQIYVTDYYIDSQETKIKVKNAQSLVFDSSVRDESQQKYFSLMASKVVQHQYAGFLNSESTFLSVDLTNQIFPYQINNAGQNTYLTLRFGLSAKVQRYEIFDPSCFWLYPFIYAGGLFITLFIMGTFMTSSVSQFEYQSDLIKRLYQRNSASDSLVRANLIKVASGQGRLTQQSIHQLWERQLGQRRTVQISPCTFCCTCTDSCKKQRKILKNGNQNISSSLDVANLVKTVQRHRLGFRAILSTKARTLLKNQHTFTLQDFRDQSCTSSSDSQNENTMGSEKQLLQNWCDWKPTNRAEQVFLSGLCQRTGVEAKADMPLNDHEIQFREIHLRDTAKGSTAGFNNGEFKSSGRQNYEKTPKGGMVQPMETHSDLDHLDDVSEGFEGNQKKKVEINVHEEVQQEQKMLMQTSQQSFEKVRDQYEDKDKSLATISFNPTLQSKISNPFSLIVQKKQREMSVNQSMVRQGSFDQKLPSQMAPSETPPVSFSVIRNEKDEPEQTPPQSVLFPEHPEYKKNLQGQGTWIERNRDMLAEQGLDINMNRLNQFTTKLRNDW